MIKNLTTTYGQLSLTQPIGLIGQSDQNLIASGLTLPTGTTISQGYGIR